MPPRRRAAPVPKCIRCCLAAEECHTGPVTGACVCCGRNTQTRGAAELPFLASALWSEFQRRDFQFDLCPDGNCSHTNTAYVRDTNTPLPVKLPPRPSLLSAADREAMDAEVARLGPPCFGDMQSPALLLYRYMSIFCPRDLAMSESRAAERSRLILGSAILTRLSELLIDATETVRNVVWKSDEVPGDDHDDNRARREAGLQELAVLFFCLNGVCRLLEIGRVRPMIGGNLFQHAFVEHLSRWIQVLQKHVARACSEREEWWGRIGFRNIEQLRFRNWAVKLRLVYEPCGHRQNDADSEVSIASDRDRSASVFTDVPASDVTDGLDQTLVAADDSPSEQYFYSEAVSPAPPRNGDGGDCLGNDIRLGTIDELHAIPQSPRPLATSALGACSVSHHVGYYTASDVLSPLPNPGESPSFWTGTPASVPRTAYTHTYLDHSPAFLQVNSATASWERLENRCPAPIVTPGPQPLEYPQQQQQQQQHDDPLPLLPPYSAWPARRGNDILFDSSHGYGSWQGPRYT